MQKKANINKLVEKCDEDIDGNEMVYNATVYDYGRVCKTCTLDAVFLITAFIIIMGINGLCFYFYLHAKGNYFSVLSY